MMQRVARIDFPDFLFLDVARLPQISHPALKFNGQKFKIIQSEVIK
jgi:hypothetical protein